MFVEARKRRKALPAVLALAAVTPLVLAGCTTPEVVSSGAVGFDDVQTATVQIQAEGTFFEPGSSAPTPAGMRGSGFFITESGLVVTNNHVVTGAGTLKVWVGGDQSVTYSAKALGASECLDLAVLQVQGEDFPYLEWYKGDIEPALDVYSAGFPLGDPNFTLTRGIVSKADVPQEDPWASLDHVIEHDARIRGGNSGGPLVADNGKVVGVNYAGEDTLDYNFAIHRDQVVPVIDRLAAGELVLTLGINAKALAPGEDGSPGGIWVASVKAGGAASAAGVRPGDVLYDLGGVQMSRRGTLQEYCEVIATQGPEATIPFTVYRPSDGGVYEGEMNGAQMVLTSGGQHDPTPPNGSFTAIQDDSGTVMLEVPSHWGQVSGAAIQGESTTMPAVSASPDLAAFSGTWGTPGVTLAATNAAGATVDTYLAGFGDPYGAECSGVEPGDYDDGLYLGKYQYYSGCGGTTTDLVVLVARDIDDSHLIVLTVQMVSDDDKGATLTQILQTFQAKY